MITFSLQEMTPQDVTGSLCDTCSLFCGLHCHAAKHMLKEALPWAFFNMQATGPYCSSPPVT